MKPKLSVFGLNVFRGGPFGLGDDIYNSLKRVEASNENHRVALLHEHKIMGQQSLGAAGLLIDVQNADDAEEDDRSLPEIAPT